MKINYYLLFFSILIGVLNLSAQKTVISETLYEFNTYPYSDPDPVANIGKVYPYFRFDGYAHCGRPQQWKVITLENPYIKVFILPDIGGKIWGALDKISGKMFIYYNHSVKFRNIAMRGPWTSGGIESNFGIIGHAPTCSSPVDYYKQENKDGSVSCFIGARDLITGTVWRVEIRLPREKAYFETNTLWHNPTPLEQPYYHWMNAAAYAKDDLHFYFPGHSYIGHDGHAHSWPKDKADRDLSYYAQNNFGPYKSYHVLGELSGFFGGYFHNEQFGFGKWSLYGDKPGKKLWIWGLSRQGMIWEDLLTDSDGQYIEWQSGRLFNQAAGGSSETPFKHREFTPFGTDKWSEIWFPIKGTGGVKAASPYGIINYVRKGENLIFYFSPLQNIHDYLVITSANKIFYNKQLNLKPLELFVDSLKIDPLKNFTIVIGRDKLRCSSTDSEDNYLHRPLNSPVDFDRPSIQGLALKGREAARQHNYQAAFKAYRRCLKIDRHYIDALNGIARLFYRNMDYDSALAYIKHALSIDTYSPKANYLYGVINRRLNAFADAKDGFSIAAHDISRRSAAYTQLAEISLIEGDYRLASDYVQRALDYNRYNIRARENGIIALRKSGEKAQAKTAAQKLLQLDILNHFARFELYLISSKESDLKNFTKYIRNELPLETYLQLAVQYSNLTLHDNALSVLQNAPRNAIVLYWQAYLHHLNGNEKQARALLEKAEKQTPYLVFPFREETADILKWALSQNNHWKTRYYLALIYWNRGQTEKAAFLFDACANRADYAPFYLTRAKFFSTRNLQKSIKDCRQALKLKPNGRRAAVMLSELYNQAGNETASLKAIETAYRKNPTDYRLAVPYAQALYRTGEYKQCISVLDKTDVLPFEGASGARRLFHDAHLMSALLNYRHNNFQQALEHTRKAKLWPEHLGAGKPYEPNELSADFIEMITAKRMNNSQTSEKLSRKINNYLKKHGNRNVENDFVKSLLLINENKTKEARNFLQNIQSKEQKSYLFAWLLAHLDDNRKQKNDYYSRVKNKSDYRLYMAMAELVL